MVFMRTCWSNLWDLWEHVEVMCLWSGSVSILVEKDPSTVLYSTSLSEHSFILNTCKHHFTISGSNECFTYMLLTWKTENGKLRRRWIITKLICSVSGLSKSYFHTLTLLMHVRFVPYLLICTTWVFILADFPRMSLRAARTFSYTHHISFSNQSNNLVKNYICVSRLRVKYSGISNV